MSILRNHLCSSFLYNYVDFQDANTEKLCMKYLSSKNAKGVLYSDIVSVKKIPEEMLDDKLCEKIIKFNEFKFFANLQSYNIISFRYFDNLEEIEYPLYIKYLNAYLPRNYKITHLRLPHKLQVFQTSYFEQSIIANTVIEFPENIQDIQLDRSIIYFLDINFVFNNYYSAYISNVQDVDNFISSPYNLGYCPDGAVNNYKQDNYLMQYLCYDIKEHHEMPESVSKQLWEYKLKFKN